MLATSRISTTYMTMPILRMVQKRAGWLVILFLGEMLTATSSAPFVATLVDVTGLIICFSVGYLILEGTLL